MHILVILKVLLIFLLLYRFRPSIHSIKAESNSHCCLSSSHKGIYTLILMKVAF